PEVNWHRLPELTGLAIALTIIALGQSYSIAKVLSERSGQYVDANREFVGQGLSNIAGGFFSCFLSCGSLNRSLPNLEAGARTPLASVFSALWLLALVALSAGLIAAMPMAAVSGLLLLVAWSLLDVAQWRRLLQLSQLEFGIAFATLVATLAIRLELAILFGTMLSLAAYLWRTARPAMRTMGFDSRANGRPFVIADDNPRALPECPQLKLLRMEGAVYFGATQHVGERLHALRGAAQPQTHLLVMSKSMNFIDLAGDELWRDEMRQRRACGGDLYFHRPRPPVLELWQRSGFLDELGRDHVFPDKRIAIATIVPKLDRGICARCSVKLFDECPR
ncbi:MAG TPA: SulP family inorganic anion transporter, partial [Burkholderiaceae bacterium]|nr:SulP family inorganic anion transporter [Burkholderiaceae bacterium]